MAVKTSWAAGDVLLAADLTDTFAAKAPLASPALTGTPTAPTAAAGTKTTQVATTAFVQSEGGFVLVEPTSVTNGTKSGGQVTFSGVASVSLNGVFSTYDNYRVIVNFTSFSGNGEYVLARLRASGSDAATNYNCIRVYGNGSTVGSDNPGATGFPIGYNYSSAPTAGFAVFDLMRPNVAELTKITGSLYYYNAGTMYSINYGGMHNSASAYDSISILTGAGGTMSGIVRVYGYKNS